MAHGGYSVLSSAELNRIVKQVTPEAPQESHLEKEHLKTLSDTRAQQWPNTISAQRARKERERQDRLAAEEEEKKKVDAMEAELKAEQRQLQIERANKMLYDETDKVKAFHSSLLLSDVLDEREKQISYKERRKLVTKRHESEFVKKQKEALEIAEAAEQRKFEERRNRALVERDAQLAQLEGLRNRILDEKEENRREGLELKAKAEEEVRLMQAKEEQKREQARLANLSTINANEALRAFRDIEQAQEREQDIKTAAFAKQKEQMILSRKRREQEKQAEKQARRDKMVAVMERNLLEVRQEADVRLQRDENEARIAEDMREYERAEARRLENVAQDVSRKQQLDIRAARRTRAKQEEEAFVAQWKVRNEQIKMEEEQEKMHVFQRNKRLQAAHLRQIDRKATKMETHKQGELEDALATRLVMEEDAQLFNHYTDVCLEEWQAKGKNVKPLLLEINKKQTFSRT